MLNRFIMGKPGKGGNSMLRNTKAKDEMKAKLLAKQRGEVVKEKDFKTQVWETVQQKRIDLLSKGQNAKFQLPGTKSHDPTQSKSYLQAMELMKQRQERKLKKQVKKRENMALKGRYFGNLGRMDGKGNVMDAAGKHILTVDKKTGKVMNKMGFKVGQYDPLNPTSVWQMENLIKKYTTVKGSNPLGNFWGGGPSS